MLISPGSLLEMIARSPIWFVIVTSLPANLPFHGGIHYPNHCPGVGLIPPDEVTVAENHPFAVNVNNVRFDYRRRIERPPGTDTESFPKLPRDQVAHSTVENEDASTASHDLSPAGGIASGKGNVFLREQGDRSTAICGSDSLAVVK